MKSDLSESKEYIECACGDIDHIITLDRSYEDYWYEKGNIIEIGWGVGHTPLWWRIKACYKYLFKNEPLEYCHIILNKSNVAVLKAYLGKFLNYCEGEVKDD